MNDRRRPQVSKALFEAWSVNLDILSWIDEINRPTYCECKAPTHGKGFRSLMTDDEFMKAISYGYRSSQTHPLSLQTGSKRLSRRHLVLESLTLNNFKAFKHAGNTASSADTAHRTKWNWGNHQRSASICSCCDSPLINSEYLPTSAGFGLVLNGELVRILALVAMYSFDSAEEDEIGFALMSDEAGSSLAALSTIRQADILRLYVR